MSRADGLIFISLVIYSAVAVIVANLFVLVFSVPEIPNICLILVQNLGYRNIFGSADLILYVHLQGETGMMIYIYEPYKVTRIKF